LGGALMREGGLLEALEEHLGHCLRAQSVLLTSSGTHALQLALRLVRTRREEGPVALPAYSCFDLVTAAVGSCTSVRFYDVDPRTLSPVLESLEAVISEGVSAVVAGNLYGYPVDWGGLRELCGSAGIPLIEDAAQGLGSRTARGATGTLGDLTVLSFGRGKGWTGGGGGALLLRGAWEGAVEGATTDSAGARFDDARNPVGLRRALVTLVAWSLGRPALYGAPASLSGLGLGETRYHEPSTPGRISRFSAALAARTAESAAAAVEGRRRVAGHLVAAVGQEAVSGPGALGPLRPCDPIGGDDCASFLRLAAVAPTPQLADRIATEGVRFGLTRGYPTPLPELPQSHALQSRSPHRFPGADRLASCLVTLPTHRWVTSHQIDRLHALLRHQ
jgi:dTDP-4-amino-4,6-dideoxygalactose transaminase